MTGEMWGGNRAIWSVCIFGETGSSDFLCKHQCEEGRRYNHGWVGRGGESKGWRFAIRGGGGILLTTALLFP